MLGGLEKGADPREALEAVLAEISEASECESVGIRWRAEEDYPYLATRGFGIEFIVRESPLCDRDSAGLIIRHADGTPQLACMCGAIIQGRTDPSLPYFTKAGSFWTNGSSAIAAAPPPDALRIKLRAYCVAVGYDSVALIPLRAEGKIYGLLQLNSRSPNRFTKERIELYERVANEIARAAVRRAGQR
jgi:GAF domain-containing protein